METRSADAVEGALSKYEETLGASIQDVITSHAPRPQPTPKADDGDGKMHTQNTRVGKTGKRFKAETMRIHKHHSVKEEYRARMRRDKEDMESHRDYYEKQDDEGILPSDVSGESMTWSRFKDIMQDPYQGIEFQLSEPSLAHVVKNLIDNRYSWQPRNIVFDESNLPASKIKGQEETFRHLLSTVDGRDRQRVDHLHNLVNKPDVSEYMERNHITNTDLFASDQSGAIELFDDWSLPYDPNVRKVSFNHHIHTQMRFGTAFEGESV